MLQQVKPAMIDARGVDDGSALQADGEQAKFKKPAPNDDSPPREQLSFDATTGVLTIRYTDGQTATVSGFPTTAQISKGRKGDPGRRGEDGRPGNDGRNGRDGLPGCPGRKGDRGRVGPTGPTGAVGPTGITGPTGPVGPTGPKGATGADAPTSIYNVVNFKDPDTEIAYPDAFIGSEFDPATRRIRNFGRVKARQLRDTINVVFERQFVNRCVSLQLTFVDADCNQSKKYALYTEDGQALTSGPENLMLGGFVIKVSTPNDRAWDFFFEAIGD